jgi:hypothetical protein
VPKQAKSASASANVSMNGTKKINFALFHQIREQAASMIQRAWRSHKTSVTQRIERKEFLREIGERVVRMDPINKSMFLYTCFLLQHLETRKQAVAAK